MGHLSVFPTGSNIERNVPLETRWLLNNKHKVYLQTGVAEWSVIIYKAFEDFFLLKSCESTAFPLHWKERGFPNGFLHSGFEGDLRSSLGRISHSRSLFSFSVLVSLTHLFGSEGPVIQSRSYFSPSEVITFAWDSTHPHRSPGEPRQADGSTLFPPPALCCSSVEPCCRYSSAGLERKLSRDQRQWSSSH